MKRSKSLSIILILGLLISLCAPLAVSAETDTWGGAAGYTVNDDGSISTTSAENQWMQFFINNASTAKGDYTISADLTGTIDTPVSGENQMGIVPWYVDSQNYIVAYIAWANWDRPHEARNLEITGMIDGVDLGWHDKFTDGCGILPADGARLEVTKEGKSIKVSMYSKSGALIADTTRVIDSLAENDGAKWGVYLSGDVATASNITFTDNNAPVSDPTDAPLNTAWTVRDSGKDGYTIGKDSISAAGVDNSGWNFLLADEVDLGNGDFTMSAVISGTITENVSADVQFGLVPWYVDDDNWLVAYINWASWDRPHEIRNLEITGMVNGVDISWFDIYTDGCGVHPGDTIKLETVKKGNEITISAYRENGEQIASGTRNNIGQLPESENVKVGLYASGDIATFRDLKIEVDGASDVPQPEQPWNEVDGKLVYTGSFGQRDNNGIYFDEENVAIGNYTVAMDIQGTMGFPNNKTTHAGFMPWYLDNNNYIYAYVEWADYDRPGNIREIQVTGMIDGVPLVVYSDGFVEKQWNDIWCDGIAVPSNEGVRLVVQSSLSAVGDTVELTVSLLGKSGETLKSGVVCIRELVKYASVPAKVGIYAYNDTFTFCDYSFTSVPNGRTWTQENGLIAKAENGSWTLSDGTYRIDASASATELGNVVLLKNELSDKSYILSAEVARENIAAASQVGFLAWYRDGYNYLYATVKQTTEGCFIGFEGVTSTINGATLTQEIISQYVPFTGDMNAIKQLRLEKRGARFAFHAADVTVEYVNDDMLNAADYGLVTMGANTAFSKVEAASAAFNAYDWITVNIGGKEYFVSAKTDDGVRYEDGALVIDAAAVDASGETLTKLYTASGKFDIVTISASFDVSDTSVWGVYPWLISENKYILVQVTPQGIVLSSTFSGESKTYALPSDYTYGGTHTIEATVKNGSVTVALDGKTVVAADDFKTGTLDNTLSPNAGIVASVTAVTVKDISIDGFSQYSTRIDGDWELRGGAHADTWIVAADGSTITGKYDGGTQWMGTLALKEIENAERNFFMSASILVTDTTASEYKTGLLPYYIDSNNYLFVWLSKWADGSPCINMTCRLNGQVIGSEWREQNVSYSYVGVVNDMEVEINGDEVRVYLNKSFYPSFTTTFEGLSERSMEGVMSGFNISNTSAVFSSIVLRSEKRTQVLTDKPVLEEVTSRVTTGKVNQKVTVPIYSASNTAGETLEAVIRITAPDGSEVALERGGFVPTVAGEYTVTVTVTDLWGNEADPIVYTVTVADEGASEPTPGQPEEPADPEESEGVSAGVIIAIVAAVVIVAAAVVMVILRKKKQR